MTKLVDAIVRGPQPYFSAEGVLLMPGQIAVGVPAEDVGTDNTRDIEVEVEARNGDLRMRKVAKPVQFRPLADAPTIGGEVTAATVATGQPDRLNVTDFLKQGEAEMVAAIASGSVDDFLGVIEQGELSRKGPARKAVTAAVAARQAGMGRS